MKIQVFLILKALSIPANDIERTGVWSHAFSGQELAWFSPKWNCWGRQDEHTQYGAFGRASNEG